MATTFSSIEEWLAHVDAPVSDFDRRLIYIASADETAVLIKDLAKNDLLTSNCACIDEGRFHCDRRLGIEPRWDEAYIRSLRKWLYECGILFSTDVRMLFHRGYAIHTTWKFIVRYLPHINLHLDDVIITDRTMQWALTYCHHPSFGFHCYQTRPKNGRKNWKFVLRVHEGLIIHQEPPIDTHSHERF